MKRSSSGRWKGKSSVAHSARRARVHTHLVALFGAAAVLLVVLNIGVLLTPTHQASATNAENVTGWAWSDTGGWLSLNNINSGAGGGTYGVHVDPSTKAVTGFAWSDNQGWACFGASCAVASCANGANTPQGSAPTASIDSSNRLRGWGLFCNMGPSGGGPPPPPPAPTYFASASTPADNGTNTASPTVVTPPGSMLTGDLVLMYAWGSGTTDPVISETGGQSWTSEAIRTSTSRDGRLFWARYNGTWSANPSVTMPGVSNNILVMHVFRPGNGASTWAIDVAESTGTYSAPASPFTVTRNGVTTLTDNAVAVAAWTSADDNTWGSLSGSGWSVLGSAQYRNTSGTNDDSQAFAYRILGTAGATGNVSLNQSALGGDAGTTSIIAFKEVPPPPGGGGSATGWISLNCLDAPAGCGPGNYGPVVNFGTGVWSGFAWHGIVGSGWGWIDFSGVRMSTVAEGSIVSCHDSIDNDLDGPTDCLDNGCYQQPAYNCPAVETQCGLLGLSNCCSNTTDDDNDALIDCADVADCSADAACIPEICTNGIEDGDPDSDTDCADSECTSLPACTPPWLQAQYGNIYAKSGITGNAPPPGQANATYCITSAGSISNFTSEQGCLEGSSSESYSLPTSTGGYISNLGRLDVAGILAGRYGTVTSIATSTALPAALNGGIYLYDRDAQGGTCPSWGPNGAGTAFAINAKTFTNASGSTGRGNGLLVIKGCDLRITGNLAYQGAGISQYLRNLASFGVLVLAKYSGGVPVNGGHMFIDPSVTQIVGLYFAERSLRTGSTGNTFTDVQLNAYGAFVSRDVRLQRRFGSPTNPAENVVFDGRGVANPPPGMQDVTKSLPSLKDKY